METQTLPDTHEKSGGGLGMRHVQVFLLFTSMLLCYCMRVDMSMAIVAINDDAAPKDQWSVSMQSVVLSSFFWGYIVLQLPSGELAARWGGKPLVWVSVGGTTMMTALMPLAVQFGGYGAASALRAVQGLAQGFLFPAMHALIGKWVPLHEKSRLGTIIYSGAQLGTALQLIVSGFIAEAWGWPMIFYVNAVLGAVWCAVYMWVGASAPHQSRYISKSERHYIETSIGQDEDYKKPKTPWKILLTSPACIALMVAHIGQDWGFWSVMKQMPSYMSQVLDVDITTNGMLSAVPYIAMYLLSFVFGYLSDLTLKKQWLSITACRKLSNSIGAFGPASALVALTFAPAGNLAVAVLILTLAVGINAGHYTGFLLMHIDMTPNFAGSLMSITNFLANVACIFAPLVAGLILTDDPNEGVWRMFFYTTAAVYVACNAVFLVFASSERQPWDEAETPAIGPDSGESKKTPVEVA
ncbi:putative inorganic phosphate cotransporter [Manduca sexta]|uniref:putative inorganic phosphate cotransporter n=1 Tax=Manduca sexta TaxID=7130 RepID=UPI00189015DA|nr:putative inorganic phosphate cotransporter [Manduca sexta]